MTDLETEIRAALAERADDIDADDLRGADHPRPRRPLWPVLAAAAVVAALALGSAVFFTRSDAPPAGPLLDGTSWRLVSVAIKGSTVAAPASAGLEFRDGHVFTNDSMNSASGDYRPNSTGFRVRNAASFAVGYGGNDPGLLSAIDGMHAVTTGAQVAARIDGDSLVLRVQGYTLRLERLLGFDAAVGVEWMLVSVRTGGRTIAAPARPMYPPVLVLYANGTVFAEDSVNDHTGKYRRTADGFKAYDVKVTAVGYPSDLSVDAARKAVFGITGGDPVTVQVSTDTLVLRGEGFSATFRNHGPAKAR